jgi:hypothetical protein
MYLWLCNMLYMECPVHSVFIITEREVTLAIQTIRRICHKDVRVGRCSSTPSYCYRLGNNNITRAGIA